MIELTQYTAISNKPTAIEQVLISVDRLMATFPYVIRINRNEVPNIIRALGPVAYGVTDNSASFLPPHLRPTPPVQDTVIDSEIRHLHEEIKRMQLTNGEMFKRIGILESQMSSTGDRLDSQFQEIATVINGNDAAINAITEDTGNIKERITQDIDRVYSAISALGKDFQVPISSLKEWQDKIERALSSEGGVYGLIEKVTDLQFDIIRRDFDIEQICDELGIELESLNDDEPESEEGSILEAVELIESIMDKPVLTQEQLEYNRYVYTRDANEAPPAEEATLLLKYDISAIPTEELNPSEYMVNPVTMEARPAIKHRFDGIIPDTDL